MEEFLSTIIDLLVVGGIIAAVVLKNKKKTTGQHVSYNKKPGKYDTYNKPGKYVTYNKKSIFNTAGAQPHVHETNKYKSYSDASKLPPGYILLNGEPVRVADLDGK